MFFTSITLEIRFLFSSLLKPPPPPPPPPPDDDVVVVLVNAKPNADAAADKKDARGNSQDGRTESFGEKLRLWRPFPLLQPLFIPLRNCRECESCNSTLYRNACTHIHLTFSVRVRSKKIHTFNINRAFLLSAVSASKISDRRKIRYLRVCKQSLNLLCPLYYILRRMRKYFFNIYITSLILCYSHNREKRSRRAWMILWLVDVLRLPFNAKTVVLSITSSTNFT